MNIKLTEQLDTLRTALEIAQKQITETETLLTQDFASMPTEEQKERLKSEAIFLYLKNFWQHYEFLIKKIETESNLSDFQFYIPLARILFENYGQLLYFLNQDRRTQIGIFVGNYLLHLREHYCFIALQNINIKQEYDRYLLMVSSVLSSENIIFPTDINLLSKASLEKLRFNFPKTNQPFLKPYFASLSTNTFAFWPKESPATFYNIYYKTYSSYSHRSFTNQVDGTQGTELFWIIQFMYLIAQLIFELCDKRLFNSRFSLEYGQFATKIHAAHPRLLNVWREKIESNALGT